MVHEFVNSDGLNALITVGTDADQNYQNYILRGKKIYETMETKISPQYGGEMKPRFILN